MRSLLIALLCLCSPTIIFAASGDLGVAKGANGSETSPWLIEDFDDFNAFCNDSSKWAAGQYTRLEANIDLDPNLPSRVIYTQAPIAGDSDTDFFFEGTAYAGSFDGNGQVITNLQINGTYFCGLFGKTEFDCEISNLGIENASITGSGYYLGGLCGYNSYGTISNCYATGAVSGDGYIGGLCGRNDSGTISNCYAAGSVSGGSSSDYIGGLCGYNRYGTISNCYATGAVSGDDYIGGLCGRNDSGTISNCYAVSSVLGVDYLGGLCGRNYRGTISNCYAAGSVSGGSSLGGLCGENYYGTISNCYAASSVTGGDYSRRLGGLCGYNYYGTISNCYFYVFGGPDNGYGTPLNDTQLLDSASFIGFDFTGDSSDGTEDIWCITTGYMPRLYWQSSPGFTPPYLLDDISTTLSGTGYPDDPFIISYFDDMIEFRTNSSLRIGYYSLQSDIDLSGTTYPDAFIPESFNGHFDGNGYSISNLSITGSRKLGLFSMISGRVSNLGIENIDIVASGDYIGGLCGENYYGTISNCYAAGSVSGGSSSDYIGGLCGENESGTISNCYATGSVTGVDYSLFLGGLCGYNDSGTISSCYATGAVSGFDVLGGLCGYNDYGTISNCYAAGSVSGGDSSYYLGGLCGKNESGTITNCYATGSVSGVDDSRYLGGLCGYQYGHAFILNCFWDTQTSGLSIGVNLDSRIPGTVTNLNGLTTAQMQDINTFLNADWDFVAESANGTEDLWHMPYQTTGYPMLFFQRDIPGDLTGSYGVNLEDFGYLSKSWQDNYTITDLQTLAQYWLEGN